MGAWALGTPRAGVGAVAALEALRGVKASATASGLWTLRGFFTQVHSSAQQEDRWQGLAWTLREELWELC